MTCVIGLDIGTTSTIGILIRVPSQRLALASRPVTLTHRHAGWAEEDPRQWWTNVCDIVPELLAQANVGADEVRAVGVSGMVPAMVLLDQNPIQRPDLYSAKLCRITTVLPALSKYWLEDCNSYFAG